MADWETELSEDELEEIIQLLFTTKLTIDEIAQRTGQSAAIIAAVKRRYLDRPKDRPS